MATTAIQLDKLYGLPEVCPRCGAAEWVHSVHIRRLRVVTSGVLRHFWCNFQARSELVELASFLSWFICRFRGVIVIHRMCPLLLKSVMPFGFRSRGIF